MMSMKKLPRLMLASLVGMSVFVTACGDEETPPEPVTGNITGMVSTEGAAVEGVTVSLSGTASLSRTTAADGAYSFNDVEEGSYSVAISGFGSDMTFTEVSKNTSITSDGETQTVNFEGTYVRTSSVVGTVTVGGQGVEGVMVMATGPGGETAEAETGTNAGVEGSYTLTGLRAGEWTVEISDLPFGTAFLETSQTTTVAVGAFEVLHFVGDHIRSSKITGVVSAGGEALAGISVTGMGPDGEPGSATTGDDGMYEMDGLRAGDWTVEIGEVPAGYTFDMPSMAVYVGVGAEQSANFMGEPVRSSTIAGTVSVGGAGVNGVKVSATGPGGETAGGVTATNIGIDGSYLLPGLRSGTWTVEIEAPSGSVFTDEESSKTTDVGVGGLELLHFIGDHDRSATISGTVTVAGEGKGGVMVNGSGPGGETSEAETAGDGTYTLMGLRAGQWTVELEVPEGYVFEITSMMVGVGVGAMVDEGADFDGEMDHDRSATISGRVTFEGAGLAGVGVMGAGPDAETSSAVTAEDGSYTLEGLRMGEWTVVISGWEDKLDYGAEFDAVIRMVEVGEGATVGDGGDFAAEYVRNGKIRGRVSMTGGLPVEGAGVKGNHAGGETASATTDDRGNYTLSASSSEDGETDYEGLRAGQWIVEVDDPSGGTTFEDPFEEVNLTIDEGQVTTGIASFVGQPVPRATITVTVSVEGEGLAGATVSATGPGDDATAEAGDGGTYTLSGLLPGEWTVTVAVPDAGDYVFADTETKVDVGPGGSGSATFDGAHNRGASISGKVTVDGEAPTAAVEVNATGPGGETATAMTDGGSYTLSASSSADGETDYAGLRKGTWTVTVTAPEGYDDITDMEMSLMVPVKTGEAVTDQDLDFDLTPKDRSASITGTVSGADGEGLEGVTVKGVGDDAAGNESVEATTASNGSYNALRPAGGHVDRHDQRLRGQDRRRRRVRRGLDLQERRGGREGRRRRRGGRARPGLRRRLRADRLDQGYGHEEGGRRRNQSRARAGRPGEGHRPRRREVRARQPRLRRGG